MHLVGAGGPVERVGSAGTGRARVVGQRPVVEVRGQAGRLVGGDLGYLTLPGFAGGGAEAAAYVASAREVVAHAEATGPCGWLVDLRGNGGGNVGPMLMAATPFLRPGAPLGFADANGQRRWARLDEDGAWRVDGNPVDAGDPLDVPAPCTPPRPAGDQRPVAALVGPATASAGEWTAIALMGQPRTRLFGARTAGIATARFLQ